MQGGLRAGWSALPVDDRLRESRRRRERQVGARRGYLDAGFGLKPQTGAAGLSRNLRAAQAMRAGSRGLAEICSVRRKIIFAILAAARRLFFHSCVMTMSLLLYDRRRRVTGGLVLLVRVGCARPADVRVRAQHRGGDSSPPARQEREHRQQQNLHATFHDS